MNASPNLSTDIRQSSHPSNPARFFHAFAAVLLFVLMFLGFQQFYLHGKAFPGRELTPPIRTLLILHGATMSAWMVLFVVQPLLIVSGNRRAHLLLGKIGAVLAAGVVVLGIRVGIEAARFNPPDLHLWGLNPKQFLAIPLVSIFIFAIFVALGVWKRRRSEAHRAMMLLSILAVLPAAMDRIPAIRSLYSSTIFGTIFGPFFSTLVVGLLFFVVKWFLTRLWDKWYAIGYAALVAAGALIMQLATTSAWERFASALLG